MAKFSVGEKVKYIGPVEGGLTAAMVQAGVTGAIESIGPNYDTPPECASMAISLFPGEQLYEVHWDFGNYGMLPEKYLAPIPPDSHADDTTEDPGVTRLKKLLQEDAVKVKTPVKA